MPPGWFADVRPAVRDGVQTLLERAATTAADDPLRTFHQLTTDSFIDNTSAFEVAVPGDRFTDEDRFADLYAGEFDTAARTIYEELPEPSTAADGERQDRIDAIERALFEFTGVVANYAGELRFDEDAFAAAFAEQFEPRYTDRRQSRFLLCLRNTLIEPDVSIDLEPDLQGEPAYLGPYEIESLRIRALDELEETGVASYEAPHTDVLERIEPLSASQPNPAVELVLRRRRTLRDIAVEIDDNDLSPWHGPEFDVTPIDVSPWQRLTKVVRYVATCVRRCLRLEAPGGTIGFERGYHVRPGWETYRRVATPVTVAFDFDCPRSSVQTHITENRGLELKQFWADHRRQLRPDGSQFRNPLSRFEQMFERDRVEDQLLDCAVGCETTLLKGGSPGGNQYRLGLRAAALIGDRNAQNWPPERVGEFFRTLYDWRNSVVHDDKTLPNDPQRDDRIEIGDRTFLADAFLPLARRYYADVLRSYLELTATMGCSIKEVNDQIDERILKQAPRVHGRLTDDSSD